MRIVGYTDPLTATPGERLRVMVSAESPEYRADLVRLLHGDVDPAGPGFKAIPLDAAFAGRYPGRRQPLHLGSWVEVPDHPALSGLGSFTVIAWICPTRSGVAPETVISKGTKEGQGVLLGLDAAGRPQLSLSGGAGRTVVAAARPLRRGEWVRLAAGYDALRNRAWLRVIPRDPRSGHAETTAGEVPFSPTFTNGQPLLFAAEPAGVGGRPTTAHFNGKIGGVRIHAAALDAARIESSDGAASLLAWWHFGLAVTSDRIVDIGPHGLHGCAMNLPMRGATGASWSGRHLHFLAAPDEYDAIHFHDDDIDDAGWAADFEWTVPDGLRSGVYAIRLAADDAEDHVPFFVVPKPGEPQARVAFLAPVYSYLAYANEHYMSDPQRQAQFRFDIGKALAGATEYERSVFAYVRGTPLHSLYDAHSDGSGVCYASRRRPLATTRPRYNKQSFSFGAPHQLNEDLCLVDWLDAKGHACDVLTDEVLHRAGAAALAPYRVILTGSHPEYWTEPMLDALETYLAGGGRLMYLGGNGFYWVTSVDPARPHLIEVRRNAGTRIWQAAPGETHHSTTGEPGGLWRFRGRAPQRVTGVGFTAQGNDRSSPYRRLPGSRDPRAAFIFEGVEAEIFGDYGLQLGGAGGYEIDRADTALGTPAHALRLASSFGHSDAYQHVVEEMLESDGQQGGTVNPLVRADMAFFEGPKGGAVFSVGSISWCAALSARGYDNDVSRITDNVLRRFSSDEPFILPGDTETDKNQ